MVEASTPQVAYFAGSILPGPKHVFDFDNGVNSLLFVRAFGFHMLGHLPLHILQHGCLSCWCLERKHKEAKVFMNANHKVTESWDLEVLKSITEASYWKLSAGSPNFLRDPGLIQPQPVTRGGAFAQYFEAHAEAGTMVHSPRARISAGFTCCAGDVVIVRKDDVHTACEVRHFFACTSSNHVFAIGSIMDFVSQDAFDARVSMHAPTTRLMCVELANVQTVSACWLSATQGVRVVVPAWLCYQGGFAWKR
jgi:hypothetical protein